MVRAVILGIIVVLLALNGLAFASEEDRAVYNDFLNELKEKSLYRFSDEEFLDIRACFLANADGLSKKEIVSKCFSSYDKYARYKELEENISTGVGSAKIQGIVGFLKINSFSVALNTTFTDIIPVLEEFRKEQINLLIIDLRGNEGGLVRETVDFLNQFAPAKGITIIELRGRRGKMLESTIYVAWDRGRCAGWKIAVLVDEETASAAEVVAGVLQIWGARVFGTKTFGKGVAQSGFRVEDDKKAIYITTEKIFFPNGVSYDGVGIVPDVKVPGARALEKALKYLKSLKK